MLTATCLLLGSVAFLPDGLSDARFRVRTDRGEANIAFAERDGVARAEGPWVRAELRVDRVRGLGKLVVTTLDDLTIFSEALELRSTLGPVAVADRAFRFQPLLPGHRAHQDPSSPHAVRLGDGDSTVTFPGYDNFPSIEVERFAENDTRIRFELDHAANHPHFSYACEATRKPKANRFGFAWDPDVREPARTELSALTRKKGDVRTFAFRFSVGRPREIYWKAREAAPYRAVMVFTDHADQALYERFRAVLYGDSDPARHNSGGFLGHRLPFTKSVFTRNDGATLQLARADYRAMALEAAARGVEFGPHTVTSNRDTREQTAAGLEVFAKLGATTWIDHSPLTNCEAIGNQGWNPASPYYVLDFLKRFGYRALWSPVDIAGGEEHLNMMRPEAPSFRRLLVFENPRVAPGFWFFATHRVFDRFEKIQALFGRANLDRFAAERGVLVAHTYLDFHRPASGYNERSWLIARGARRYVLKPEANALLGELARRRDAGELWIPTVRDFVDHVAATRDVSIDWDHDGAVVAHNRSGRDLPAFQLVHASSGRAIPFPLKNGERRVVAETSKP
ncbi:MAG: hypothetical protein HYY84_14750 [Deltaproteobacteria bacterium]|nr:hypothetical protein [Deltaproteobacteria bacterium]